MNRTRYIGDHYVRMTESIAGLRQQAQRCRKLAKWVTDDVARAALDELALDLDRRAEEEEHRLEQVSRAEDDPARP